MGSLETARTPTAASSVWGKNEENQHVINNFMVFLKSLAFDNWFDSVWQIPATEPPNSWLVSSWSVVLHSKYTPQNPASSQLGFAPCKTLNFRPGIILVWLNFRSGIILVGSIFLPGIILLFPQHFFLQFFRNHPAIILVYSPTRMETALPGWNGLIILGARPLWNIRSRVQESESHGLIRQWVYNF